MMTEKQGLTLVFTGNGKGKTTAALGTALRACGQGMKVLVLQFIKGSRDYGELKTAEMLAGNLEIYPAGRGFAGRAEGEELEKHRRAAREALEKARTEMRSGQYGMVVLDEINYAVFLDLVSKEQVIQLIREKPGGLHLVLTGRNAGPEITELADMVTEMKEVKHHATGGVKAQPGIEF